MHTPDSMWGEIVGDAVVDTVGDDVGASDVQHVSAQLRYWFVCRRKLQLDISRTLGDRGMFDS